MSYSTSTQLQVVAMLARGDTHKAVSEATNIPIASVGKIKARNQGALDTIKQKIVEHETTKAKQLLDKSHELLERKLDKLDSEEELAKTTLSELTSVSREMHSQSKDDTEAAAPSGETTQAQLKQIVAALEKGDEIELLKMTVRPK